LCFNSFAVSFQKAKEKEPLSEWSRQWLEEVVPYIITPKEKEVFINLPNEVERGKFIEIFWKKRDPNPQTPENEYKLEYYRRIALANKLFTAGGIQGWRTDRGKIYILLGPPKEIQRDLNPSSSSPMTAFQGPKETWQYWGLPNPNLPYNMEFVFIDKFGTGNYALENSLRVDSGRNVPFDSTSLTYQFDSMEFMAEAQKNPFEGFDKLKEIITTQVTYNLIPLTTDFFFLKGPEKKTYIPFVIQLPLDSIEARNVEGKKYYSLNLILNVSNPLGQIIFEKSKDINIQKTLAEVAGAAGRIYRFQSSLFLEPGSYKLHLLILDNFSGKIGTFHQDISVPNYEAGEFALSPIILSSLAGQISEKTAGENQVGINQQKLLTEADRTFHPGEELNVYCEVYSLSLNQQSGLNNFRVDYIFLQAGKVITKISAPPSSPTSQKDCRIQTSFKLKNFRPGAFVLQFKVTDNISGKTQTQEAPFEISE
jgi:GWxTD domain-containing protein